MSHRVTIATVMTDAAAVERACNRLDGHFLGNGRHRLYGEQTAEGLGVLLPEWSYPLVIDTKSGRLSYDNFCMEGRGRATEAGARACGYRRPASELDAFQRRYAAEVTIDALSREGWMISDVQTVDEKTGEWLLEAVR